MPFKPCCLSSSPQCSLPPLRTRAGYSSTSPVVHWFWEVVREMDKQDLALLVQFVTGGLTEGIIGVGAGLAPHCWRPRSVPSLCRSSCLTPRRAAPPPAGTSKVPLDGFKALQGVHGPQKFQIHKAYGDQVRLPSGEAPLLLLYLTAP